MKKRLPVKNKKSFILLEALTLLESFDLILRPGIIVVPAIIKVFGLVLGPLIILFISLLTYSTSSLLSQCHKNNSENMLSIFHKQLGSFYSTVLYFSMFLIFLGAAAFYLQIFSFFMMAILNMFLDLKIVFYYLIGLGILLIPSLLANYKSQKRMHIIMKIINIFLVLVVLILLFIKEKGFSYTPMNIIIKQLILPEAKPREYISSIGSVLFLFTTKILYYSESNDCIIHTSLKSNLFTSLISIIIGVLFNLTFKGLGFDFILAIIPKFTASFGSGDFLSFVLFFMVLSFLLKGAFGFVNCFCKLKILLKDIHFFFVNFKKPKEENETELMEIKEAENLNKNLNPKTTQEISTLLKALFYFVFFLDIFLLNYFLHPMLNLTGFIGGFGASLVELVLPCVLSLKMENKGQNKIGRYLISGIGIMINIGTIIGISVFHKYEDTLN